MPKGQTKRVVQVTFSTSLRTSESTLRRKAGKFVEGIATAHNISIRVVTMGAIVADNFCEGEKETAWGSLDEARWRDSRKSGKSRKARKHVR